MSWTDKTQKVPEFDKVIAVCEGGGTRGISSACQLGVIERKTGIPVCDLFDMWAGTSTGAIEAALITCPQRYTPSDVFDMYMEDIPKIFNKSFLRGLYSGGGAVKSMYGNAELIRCLKSYLMDARMKHAQKPLLIPVYEKLKQKSVYIDNVNGFWDEFPMYLAASASASAPVYFPGLPAEYGGFKSEFIDGGVVANNPADVALVSAKRWFKLTPDQLMKRVLIVCFGTGKNDDGIMDALPSGSSGGLSWAAKIYPVMSDAQGEKAHTLVDTLLEDSYQAFNPTFDRRMPLDTVNKKDLIYMADETYRYMEENSVRVDRVCEALKLHHAKKSN